MPDESEIYFNGVKLDGVDELNEVMDVWQDAMVVDQKNIAENFGVSESTAAAIQYLRSRSRWTPDKEKTLINRDHEGDPIPLNTVLCGDF